MRGVRAYLGAIAGAAMAVAGIGCRQAAADTLEWALVQAYQNNPSLNAQRAALRATDENIPQALSGYRPKLSITTNGGVEYSKTISQIAGFSGTQTFYPRTVGANATYTLYNGLQTANRTRQAATSRCSPSSSSRRATASTSAR
jgi:outer membrane protein